MQTKQMSAFTPEQVAIIFNAFAQLAQNSNAKTETAQEIKTQPIMQPKLQPQLKQPLPQTLESIHQPYIDRFIGETVEWYKSFRYDIKKKDVEFHHIKSYQKKGQWETSLKGYKYGFAVGEKKCLRIEQVRNRLYRIARIKRVNISSVEKDFKSRLCKIIKLGESDLCLQQKMLARYFDVDYKYNYFTVFKAIDMDREYMKAATALIFRMEKSYGIFDTDREYGLKLGQSIWEIQRPYKDDEESRLHNSYVLTNKLKSYAENEWYLWFEKMVKEYEKLCRIDRDSAIKLIFDIFNDQTGFVSSGSLPIDIHDILSDKSEKETLRNRLSSCLTISFRNVW